MQLLLGSYDVWLCHTEFMRFNTGSYIPSASLIHGCDARVKVLLLAVYSVALFLVDLWIGIGLFALLLGTALALSKIPFRQYFGSIVPIYVIGLLAVTANSFSLDVDASMTPMGLEAVSAGIFSRWDAVALVGSFGFVPAGCARGCFFMLRIVLLSVASLVVVYTTTSTQLTNAFACFIRPLRVVKVPVDDIAMVLSLALRFIPVTSEEFGRIRDAQQARGAVLSEGSLLQRLRRWANVFVPLFVGLFRRADSLAIAMDARCYGTERIQRTSLENRKFSMTSAVQLFIGVVVLVTISITL